MIASLRTAHLLRATAGRALLVGARALTRPTAIAAAASLSSAGHLPARRGFAVSPRPLSSHLDGALTPSNAESLSSSRPTGRGGKWGFPRCLSTSSASSDALKNASRSSSSRPIYLDYQATTPLDPRVLDAMLPFMVDKFGNPHSRSHALGWEAEAAVEKARAQVADLIGAPGGAKEIIFTSGATESNNLAIKGVAGYYGAGVTAGGANATDSQSVRKPRKCHVITTQIEHKCVLASCRDLEQRYGWKVTYLPVGGDGLIDLKELEGAIRPGETALVSIMLVNNEIGVIQPMKEISQICKKYGVLVHTDGAQGVAKIPINVEELGVDLMSISGHKLYGPKGIGALYVRSRNPRVRLSPLFSGGGQERGLRSGTVPAFLAVGLGRACALGKSEMALDSLRIGELERKLREGLLARLPRVVLNGSLDKRYKGNVNLSFQAVEGESLMMALGSVALSSGSACTSASLEPSYVLRAIGVGEDLAHTSLRFGIGRFTTPKEIDECVEAVVENVNKLREMSPLWEMTAEGDFQAPVWT